MIIPIAIEKNTWDYDIYGELKNPKPPLIEETEGMGAAPVFEYQKRSGLTLGSAAN